MKKILIIMAALLMFSANSFARDDIGQYSIADALSLEAAKDKLNQGIAFKFGDQAHGKVTKKFGERGSNKKTNAFGKSDQQACQWAFLSAMVSLQDRAVRDGANAVINIRSNYKSNKFSSATEFQCGAGAIMAGVALLGDFVTIEK